LFDRPTGERHDVGVSSRRLLTAGSAALVLALTGCSAETTAQLKRLGLPEAASDRSPAMLDLWIGTWIAAGIVGVLVWGLIGWAVIR
jgi:cytochrome c oxidase subunit II